MPTDELAKKLSSKYSTNTLNRAIKDIQQNGISIREASRKWKVPRSTLSNYMKKGKRSVA